MTDRLYCHVRHDATKGWKRTEGNTWTHPSLPGWSFENNQRTAKTKHWNVRDADGSYLGFVSSRTHEFMPYCHSARFDALVSARHEARRRADVAKCVGLDMSLRRLDQVLGREPLAGKGMTQDAIDQVLGYAGAEWFTELDMKRALEREIVRPGPRKAGP